MTKRQKQLAILMSWTPAEVRRSYEDPNQYMGPMILALHLVALRRMGELK